ncbi:hypothetical protein ACTWQB_08855 [Piscibacillus sp. B03]|uniref:hypothetical protein n=1 Tax=Piscibacillus sp. B03 TaxID=3457430 RepID=UPI003FCDDEA9
MSLNHPSLWDVVKNQTVYKWLSYKSVFQGLIAVQVIAMVFSLMGVGSGSRGMGHIDLSIQFVSGDFVFFFTCLWAFFIAVTLDRDDNRLADQIFVTSLFSRQIANILFIVVANLIGAISILLASFAVKISHIWIYGLDSFVIFGEYTLSIMVVNLIITFFYLMLISSVGYLIGSIIRQGRLIKLVVIVLIGAMITIQNERLAPIITFFGEESNLFLFVLKVLLTSIACFGLAAVATRRLEVQ